MTTGESLPGSEKVRKLQSVLHAKAKDEPGRRFHALIDKVWREDFLAEAWRRVRRNGGAAGVDAETFADIESYGVGCWLGELARELKDGSYAPTAIFCFAGLVCVVGRRNDGVERKARVGAAGSVASGVGERSGTRFGLKRDAEVAVRTHRSHRGYRRAKIRGGVIKA